MLRSWIPQVEECTINGVGHLLHLQSPRPVAAALAGFLDHHSFTPGSAGSSKVQELPALAK
jgi:hypothetical protein